MTMEPLERRRLFDAGAGAFNGSRFHEAHERWESLWNGTVAPRDRLPIQGLIQVATALYKLERGRPDLCLTLLDKGVAKLDGAGVICGWDVARLRDDAARLARALAAGATGDEALRLVRAANEA